MPYPSKIDPFWIPYLSIRLPDPQKYMWIDILHYVDPPKPKPVYRFLEEGETIKEGDETKLMECSKVSSSLGLKVTRLWAESRFYRRPVCMQDATHRYLDIGEKILQGDEYYNTYFSSWKEFYSSHSFIYTTGRLFEIRRPFPATKPELNKLPDDPNYFYLKAGEFTKDGDEVLLSNYEKSYWEKVKNGNVDAIVSKSQEDNKCYRRKKTPTVNLCGDRSVSYFGNLLSVCRINELNLEVSTLKDQLANAMAEVNELKLVVDVVGKTGYVTLSVGDLLEEGDECYDPDTKKWNKTCNAGKIIGHRYTVQLNGETPFQYRRKIG
jgi:hypothetical protein